METLGIQRKLSSYAASSQDNDLDGDMLVEDNNDEVTKDANDDEIEPVVKNNTTTSKIQKELDPKPPTKQKVYLSKAQRKRLKKNKPLLPSSTTQNKTTTYRDEENYISTDPTTSTQHQNQKTKILSQGETKPHAYLTLQQNMLDIVGDENSDLVQKHRITRWDTNKRKYVTSTLGLEVDKIGMSSTKKIKLENGAIMKKDKLKVGQLYEKWQKKKRNVGDSIFDDDNGGIDDTATNNNISIPKNNKKNTRADNKSMKAKTSAQIAKERRIEEKNKMKYMPKADRKRMVESKRKNEKQRDEKEFNRNRSKKRKDVVQRQGKLVHRL